MYIPLPKTTKNRIPGRRYLRENKVVIWNGREVVCEHNLKPSRCKDCGGSSICEHDKRRSQCKDCGGSEICLHKKRKTLCRECVTQKKCKNTECNSVIKDNEYQGYCFVCFVLC